MARKKRETAGVNASSMADIAFLLLIFFLVTTTIASDKGLNVLLPPKNSDQKQDVEINKRNVYSILINSNNELLIEDKPGRIGQIKRDIKKHVRNYGKDPNFSDSPDAAVVSIKTDRGTTYEVYLAVLDRVRAGYHEIRADYIGEIAGRTITVDHYLEIAQQKTEEHRIWYEAARKKFPMRISDAEPSDGKAIAK
ncbi:MAG: biopolymer transporter ExbD [Bernardetiaceae bacterium]|nr:biopolymer transporter ExbD [Bernardetiaceae bacterium]